MISNTLIDNNFKNFSSNITASTSVTTLKYSHIETPLGPMIAIADKNALRLLEFRDAKHLEQRIKTVQKHCLAAFDNEKNDLIISIEHELDLYFKGSLKTFTTPAVPLGTSFQLKVWDTLRTIPFGTTVSYADLAKKIGKPTAFRAVAQANGANQFPLIIPCHRVVNTGGTLGGYSSGIERKKWLIAHEKKIERNV